MNRRRSQFNEKNGLISNGNLMVNKESSPINEEVEFSREFTYEKNRDNMEEENEQMGKIDLNN